jgi:hypothetical protein
MGTIALDGAGRRRVVNDDGASPSDSGSPSVLVDETAEDGTTFDLGNGIAGDGHSWRSLVALLNRRSSG